MIIDTCPFVLDKDRNQPEVTDKYFHDVPFDAQFASEAPVFHLMRDMPGVDGFTMKVDALYKVCLFTELPLLVMKERAISCK